MVINVTLTILTEHGTLSLFSWYLKATLSLLMRFKTFNLAKSTFFFNLNKLFHKNKYALTI